MNVAARTSVRYTPREHALVSSIFRRLFDLRQRRSRAARREIASLEAQLRALDARAVARVGDAA